MPDNTVVEAVWPQGVRQIPLPEFLEKHDEVAVQRFPAPDPAGAHNWLRDQLGKPYDLGGLFGFLFRRDWTAPDKWFCSELVEHSLAQAGSPNYKPDIVYRITPQHLWMRDTGHEPADPALIVH